MNISVGNIVSIRESADKSILIDQKFIGQRGIVKEINEDRPSPITVFVKDVGEDSFWEEELEVILDYGFADDEQDYSKIEDHREHSHAFSFYFAAEIKKSREGPVIGKIFSMSVADGYAYYEIIKMFKTKIHIKCRMDLCPDHYTAYPFGDGGSFSRSMVEPLIIAEDSMAKIFAKGPML